jgi:hypothetical protein
MNYKGEPFVVGNGSGSDLKSLEEKTQNIRLPETQQLTTHIAGSITVSDTPPTYGDMQLVPYGFLKDNLGTGTYRSRLRGQTEVTVAKGVEKVLSIDVGKSSSDVKTNAAYDGIELTRAGTYLFTVNTACVKTTTLVGYNFFYLKDARTGGEFGRTACIPFEAFPLYHHFTALVSVDQPSTLSLCVFSQQGCKVGSTETALLPTDIWGTRLGKDN